MTSEDENEVLDSLFLKQTFQLRDGSLFETEKFLVDVQEVDGFIAALNGAPVKPPPAVPKVPAVISNTTHSNALKRKAPTALPSTEPKKRRLGLNRAAMRVGTKTGAAEFKQPALKSPESSASVLSDSADTVAAHGEYCSAPATQERNSESRTPLTVEPSLQHSSAAIDASDNDDEMCVNSVNACMY